MKYLDCGVRFIFTKDYITSTRNYKDGSKCNILNGIVVISEDGKYLFDVDSNLARKFGKVIDS